MKVAHLTSVHKVNDVRIFCKECITLVNAGYEVSLVARCEKDHVLKGVRIVAIKTEKRRLARATITSNMIYHKAISLNADVYHIHDPELIPLCFLLRLNGKKVIYDAHEDLPKQIICKTWIPTYLRRLVSKIMELILSFSSRYIFSAICAATPSIENNFPSSKTELVCNYPLLSELHQGHKKPISERPYNLAYVGGISRIRSIREIVQSLEQVSSQEVRLQLVGSFESDELMIGISHMKGWSKVDFGGWVDREQVCEILNNSRAGIVLFYPEQNHINAQPNKLFEYMAAGIPVIASNFPLWKEIVEGEECGLCVDPLNPEEIAEAIQWLFDHPGEAETMGLNGRKAVEEKYNWESESKKLLKLYEEVLSN